MNFRDFSRILQQYPESGSSDMVALDEQLNKTPYCQALHTLNAMIRQKQGDKELKFFIQRAALFTADRSHLRKLLESESVLFSLKNPEVSAESSIKESEFDRRNLADEVLKGLEILKQKTQNFDHLFKELSKLFKEDLQIPTPKLTFVSADTKSPSAKATKSPDDTDSLIQEIKSTRKRLKTDNSRQSEQLEIIDQFIKSNKVTIKPPEKATKRQDLTDTNDNYSENVISETLVDILVRQGKKDKAVEVLRKLIWKFPQKKHLFAARIQDLSI